MIRWKFTFDKDEEQEWLNEYCRQGWAMVSFCFGMVTFIPCEPGAYTYQIDLLPGRGLRPDDYEGYASFMADMDVEVLQRWGRWVYLRKSSADGPFEIYTDIDSRLQLYRRIRGMFLWALALELLCSVSVWSQLARFPEEMFSRGLAGLYLVIIAVILRAVWRCGRKIEDLERQRS